MKIAWIQLPIGSHVHVWLPRAHGLIRINLSTIPHVKAASHISLAQVWHSLNVCTVHTLGL